VRRDQPSRTQRNRQWQADWAAQLPALANAYLKWKHQAMPATETLPDEAGVHFFEVTQIGLHGMSLPHSPAPSADLQLEYTDRYRVSQALAEQDASNEANVSLIKLGLLGCSPHMPTTAITIDTLEIYHQIHRWQSSFSVQAMAKVICALHGVSCFGIPSCHPRLYISQVNYMQTFRDQLVVAFDVYLDILRYVRRRVDQALGRDSPEWYLPCLQLQGEPGHSLS
jgi:hypothetical protein